MLGQIWSDCAVATFLRGCLTASLPPARAGDWAAGRDDYRIRIGDYRVVYAVDDTKRLVIVARIAHRREVYGR